MRLTRNGMVQLGQRNFIRIDDLGEENAGIEFLNSPAVLIRADHLQAEEIAKMLTKPPTQEKSDE